MKKPCKNCPFRTDKIFPINKARRSEIAEGLFQDSDFSCHMTFGDTDHYYSEPEKAKRCTGAAIFLENSRSGGLMSNLIFRFAVIRGEIKLNKLDKAAPVAKTREEFINAFDD